MAPEPALGRKLLASSTLRRTGRGGIWVMTPCIEFIWFRIAKMLSRNLTKSSVFSFTCNTTTQHAFSNLGCANPEGLGYPCV